MASCRRQAGASPCKRRCDRARFTSSWVTTDAGKLVVEIDRPEAMNGLDNATKDALLAAVTKAAVTVRAP